MSNNLLYQINLSVMDATNEYPMTLMVGACSKEAIESALPGNLLASIRDIFPINDDPVSAEFTLPADAIDLARAIRQRISPPTPGSINSYLIPTISMNVPSWFEDPEFMAWLNNPKTIVFTWHEKGTNASEWSDTIVCVDPSLSGEGSDSDMPDHFWKQIVDAVREATEPMDSVPHILVRLTNQQA